MKTLIATPCIGFVQSLIYMHKGENPTVYLKPNWLVYDSRNLLSLYAIENKFDRVMWLDSDMLFKPDTLTTLNEDMDILHCDMVSGLYVKRTGIAEPVIYDELKEPTRNKDGLLEKNIHPYMDYPLNEIFPVAGCGFGCVMTSVKLLKHVWDKFGPAFNPFPWAGEDISYRVNQLGYTIYCDSNVSCGHIGTYVFTEDNIKRGETDAST